MELEELKNIWASVDERLKKQEILEENIIKEMNRKKTNKSLNALQWSEFIGIPILLTVISLIVYKYGQFGGTSRIWDISILIFFVICIILFPYILYKIYLLMRVDLSGNIKNNLFCINKFAIIVKKERLIFWRFFLPLCVGVPIPWLIEVGTSTALWTVYICLVVFGALFGYWSYKKIYDKNIQIIKKSLEELKELEEELGLDSSLRLE